MCGCLWCSWVILPREILKIQLSETALILCVLKAVCRENRQLKANLKTRSTKLIILIFHCAKLKPPKSLVNKEVNHCSFIFFAGGGLGSGRIRPTSFLYGPAK